MVSPFVILKNKDKENEKFLIYHKFKTLLYFSIICVFCNRLA